MVQNYKGGKIIDSKLSQIGSYLKKKFPWFSKFDLQTTMVGSQMWLSAKWGSEGQKRPLWTVSLSSSLSLASAVPVALKP